LHGLTVAVKDNIDVACLWTRGGTPGLGHRRASRDAEVVARLRSAGAVVIGKTRMHELAWGMTTPGCRNPADPERMVGGSSGGSAAAVASGAVDIALGTDTGGSVRNPASLCGVFGAKTAIGELPMDGVFPLAHTQDTVGVFAANAADCLRALHALGLPAAPPCAPGRVGRLVDAWATRVEPEVAAATERTAARLAGTGFDVIDLSLQNSGLAPAASYVIMLAEAAREWWPRESPPTAGSVGAEVQGLLRLGTHVTAADYARALQVRASLRAEITDALAQVDAVLLPTCPVQAAPVGAENVRCAGRTVPIEAAHSALTALASVTGMPAISVPAQANGALPLGAQLIGRDTAGLGRLVHVAAGDQE
jgi:Asp-tRNA(Asn)/Glu-tRNA(Gln) amidotransferase A subunit family amidase